MNGNKDKKENGAFLVGTPRPGFTRTITSIFIIQDGEGAIKRAGLYRVCVCVPVDHVGRSSLWNHWMAVSFFRAGV